MSDRLSIIDDMSDARVKSRVLAQVGSVQGLWRIEMCRYRPRRSDRQNRWYWPCFVAPFAQWLRDEGNDHIDEDAAHEILKARFLVVQEQGRWSRVRSTTELNTVEFNLYLDNCALMLAQDCNITVPEPNIYHERDSHEVSTQDGKRSVRGLATQSR